MLPDVIWFNVRNSFGAESQLIRIPEYFIFLVFLRVKHLTVLIFAALTKLPERDYQRDKFITTEFFKVWHNVKLNFKSVLTLPQSEAYPTNKWNFSSWSFCIRAALKVFQDI